MDRGLDQLSVDFTVQAQKLFTTAYERFRLTTKRLDRQRDENVFQLQVEKFLATLKFQLENTAHELLMKNKALINTNHCNKLLRDMITIYLKEFIQKTRSL